jgi:hypothetical protein
VEYLLHTSGPTRQIKLESDKQTLAGDAYDVLHITAQLLDEKGNPVLHSDEEISFQVDGPARILGTDNGSNVVRENYASNKLSTANGKCLLILQSTRQSGPVRVVAKVNDIQSNQIEIAIN